MTQFGVNTLLQSDNASNTIPSGSIGYNAPERIEFAKGWIDDAASIGSQVIRYPGDWIGLEGPGKGQFNADYVAETIAIVDYAASKDIEVIYEFGQTPPWARPDSIDAGNFTPPQNPADFADAVAYLHQQFVNAGVADNVSAWEIWNEPNANLGWPTADYRNPLSSNQGIDPAVDQEAAGQYVELLNGAYDALKSIDPSVTVLGGSLAGTDFEYLQWMLDAGAKFDGLAVHPYTRNFDNPNFIASQNTAPARPTDDPRAFAEGQGLDATLNERWSFEYGLKELRKLLDQDGRTDTNLYITEMGWGVGSQGTLTVNSFETQAEYLQSALQVIEELGYIEAVTIFQLYDFTDGNLGLLDDAGNFRPGASVLRDLIEGLNQQTDGGHAQALTVGSETGTAQATAEPQAPVTESTDTIFGTSGDDRVIDGTAGDDFIIAGAGADVISATEGNDTIVGDSEDAATPDIDRVNITGPDSNPANFTFVENPDGSVTVTSAQFGTDVWYGIESVFFENEGRVYTMNALVRQDEARAQSTSDASAVNAVTGTADDDVLRGTNGADFLNALGGDDLFLGSAGNDVIVGDAEDGSVGFDRISYNGAGSQRADFIFTKNADGSITAVSDNFGTDLLYGIDGIFFDESGEFVEVDALF